MQETIEFVVNMILTKNFWYLCLVGFGIVIAMGLRSNLRDAIFKEAASTRERIY